MKMAAIQTKYKGYRFRSRLEARWAVFFDALGVEWLYEPEGFDLAEAGLYLPDFYLPKVENGLWVEIKAGMPTEVERKKMRALVNFTGKQGTFRCGEPMNNTEIPTNCCHDLYESTDIYYPHSLEDESELYNDIYGDDYPYLFCVCPWCEKVGIEFDGRGARVCGWEKHHKTEQDALESVKHLKIFRVDDKAYTYDHKKILNAAIKARSVRFEFGENQ